MCASLLSCVLCTYIYTVCVCVIICSDECIALLLMTSVNLVTIIIIIIIITLDLCTYLFSDFALSCQYLCPHNDEIAATQCIFSAVYTCIYMYNSRTTAFLFLSYVTILFLIDAFPMITATLHFMCRGFASLALKL